MQVQAWIANLFHAAEHAWSQRAGVGAVLDRLHAELGNLRHALEWASQEPVDGARVTLGLRLCAASASYWRLRHDYYEGALVIDRLLGMVDPWVTRGAGTPASQAMIPADVLASARTQAMRVRAVSGMGKPPVWMRPILEEAIAFYRTTRDRKGEGRALLQLGNYLDMRGDGGDEMIVTFRAADQAATEADDGVTRAFALCNIAYADLEPARDRSGRSI